MNKTQKLLWYNKISAHQIRTAFVRGKLRGLEGLEGPVGIGSKKRPGKSIYVKTGV